MTIRNLKVIVDGVDITDKVKLTTATKPKVILVHESTASSLIKDVFTFTSIAGLIGVGVYLDSTAMQWIGGAIAVFMTIGTAGNRLRKRDNEYIECFTFEEARAALDKMESDNA